MSGTVGALPVFSKNDLWARLKALHDARLTTFGDGVKELVTASESVCQVCSDTLNEGGLTESEQQWVQLIHFEAQQIAIEQSRRLNPHLPKLQVV